MCSVLQACIEQILLYMSLPGRSVDVLQLGSAARDGRLPLSGACSQSAGSAALQQGCEPDLDTLTSQVSAVH